MPLPTENALDIRSMGAVANNVEFDNASIINKALEQAEKIGGTVVAAGGDYTCKTVFLHSNVTLFIEYGSSIIANEIRQGISRIKPIQKSSVICSFHPPRRKCNCQQF